MAKARVREAPPSPSPAEETEEEIHAQLYRECPWYRSVHDGKSISEAGGGCTTTGESPQIKLTPHTQEASTVVKPTVPPGGPGLFHHKGLHLPPYIEHLWFHLVKRYGKQKAYGVAVGVVKKWAQGVNPGGWDTKSGKGKKTHPDVRAAAQRNVAEWEADRRMGGNGHAAATNTDMQEVLRLAAVGTADKPFPGDTLLPTTPVPAVANSKAMYSAHRVDDIVTLLAHATERMLVAKKAPSTELRDYYIRHVCNHLTNSLREGHQLVENVRENYPAEARELAALQKCIGLSKALGANAKTATFAHLLETTLHNLGHAKRHADAMQVKGDQKLWEFNFDHADKHLKGAVEHINKLAKHIHDNYPAESRWLKQIQNDETASLKMAAPPPYPSGAMTAPGTRVSAQLKHVPSQTVQPSPPLPPGAALPSQAECDKLAAKIEASNEDKNPLLTGAVKQLRDAGVKLEKKEPIHALQSLRGAQMGILACHYELRRNAVPVANVFTSTNVPPAAASSAHAAMVQSVKDRETFRAHYVAISALIDRVRRHHFHGMYGGYAMARFTRQDLERELLALAEPVD